jgi:hypothetical protein
VDVAVVPLECFGLVMLACGLACGLRRRLSWMWSLFLACYGAFAVSDIIARWWWVLAIITPGLVGVPAWMLWRGMRRLDQD